MNTPTPTSKTPSLVDALKAHYFDLALRERVGKTPELSAEADATEKLIAMLDRKCKPQSQQWRDEPVAEGWHWMKYGETSPLIVLIRKRSEQDEELIVHTISNAYSLGQLSAARYCGPIQAPTM